MVRGRHGAQRRAGRGDGDPRRAHHAGPAPRARSCARMQRAVQRRGAGALGPPRARARRRPRTPVVEAALAARGRTRGSTARRRCPTWRFLRGVPAIKCGPGPQRALAHARTSSCSRRRSCDGARVLHRDVLASARSAAMRRSGGRDDAPLGQGRAARRAGAALHRRRGPPARRPPGAVRRARPRSPTPRCCAAQGLLAADDSRRSATGLHGLAAEHAAGEWADRARGRGRPHRAREPPDAAHRRAGGRVHLGRSRNDQVLAALRLYLRDARASAAPAARDRVAARSTRWRREQAEIAAARLHPPAAGDAVDRWRSGRGGFAAELRDDADGLVSRRSGGSTRTRSARPRATACRCCRSTARRRARGLGFAEAQEPVTAVQLSRGKAEAQVLFEIALLLQDLGRLAADLVLFASSEFGFVELAPEITTGSSIMPQKRNPDLFELVRGRTATGQAPPRRGAGDHRQAALGLPPRPPAPQGAALPRHRHSPATPPP